MQFLALDLGSYKMGMAMFSNSKCVSSWTHHISKKVRDPVARLTEMRGAVKYYALKYDCSEVIMELPWAQYRSMACLPTLEDSIRAMCQAQGIKFYSYPVSTVRHEICRNGRVSHSVLELALKQEFPHLGELGPDAWDSVALGWYHVRTSDRCQICGREAEDGLICERCKIETQKAN